MAGRMRAAYPDDTIRKKRWTFQNPRQKAYRASALRAISRFTHRAALQGERRAEGGCEWS
jgi:hypothetical protein